MRPIAGLERWRTVRTRWVMALLCFAAAITVIVSSILYSWYSRDSVEAFGRIAAQELDQTSTTMEMLDESIKNTGFDLVQDVDVLTLMAARTSMEQYAAAVRTKLMHPMLSNPLIASIYLVNRNANVIVGSPAPAGVNVPEYHRRIVATIQGMKENAIIRIDSNPVWPTSATTPATPAARATTSFVSYVFYHGRMSEPDESFLIINLRSSDILARIIAAGAADGRALVVAGRAGAPVFVHNPDTPYRAEEIEAALGRVLQDRRESGQLAAVRLGRTTSLVAFAVREPLGLRFVSLTPYSVVLQSSRLLRIRTIALALLILLAGGASAVLIARRFYRPLGSLLTKYGGAGPRFAGARPTGKDEYQQLDRLLESSSARVTSLERNLPLFRQEYLQRILDGRIGLDTAGTQERLRELGIEFPHEVFRALWFAAGRVRADEQRPDVAVDAVRDTVQHFAHLVAERGMGCQLVDGGDGASMVAVVNYADDSPRSAEIIRDACMAAQARAQGSGRPLPTVAIGRSCRRTLAGSWANARDLMAYRIKYGDGAVLDDQQIAADVVGHDLFPQEEENELVEAVRTLSAERMRASVAAVVRRFRGYSANDISRAVLHVLYRTLQAMDDMMRGHPVAVDDDFLSVHERLGRCASLADMEHELAAYYDRMIGKLAAAIRRAGTSHAHIMKKVVDFIAANYASSQMSLELVADHVGMNSTYLGKIFKDYLGSHFTDYVTKVRLGHSQQLLVETTMSIAEIAQRTGFNSPSYFITCFRKHTGVTPASYRNAKAL